MRNIKAVVVILIIFVACSLPVIAHGESTAAIGGSLVLDEAGVYVDASVNNEAAQGSAIFIIAVYDDSARLLGVNLHERLMQTGASEFTCAVPSFVPGNGMTVRLFLWNGVTPLACAYDAMPSGALQNGNLIFEAEALAPGQSAVRKTDAKASGGEGINFTAHHWFIEDTTSDGLRADLYVNSEAEAGRYKLWARVRTLSTETASFWIDPGTGTFAAKYFSTVMDGEYRWTSYDIYLAAGENYFAMRSRGPAMIDKFIVTSNLNFVPVGMDDVPESLTQSELEEAWGQLYSEPWQKPIDGHPRLYITPEAIPEMKAKLKNSSEVNYRYNQFKTYANETLNCELNTSLANNHNSTLLYKILSRALVWVLGDEENIDHAKQTVLYMRDYLETFRTPDDTGDITRVRGDVLVGAAIVYDWCYDALTDDDKAFFKSEMLKLIASKEIGWPPVKMSSMASHGGEQEIFRDLLAAGIAVYDEYPLLYNVAAGRMFEEMVPARLWLRTSGRFDQGNDYGECRFYSEVFADAAMQAMGYASIYGDIKGDAARWLIRSRMPYGAMMPGGDMYSLTGANYEYYYPNYMLAICIAGNLYKDPYLKGEFYRRYTLNSTGALDITFWQMIFTDPSVETAIWDDWELSKYTAYPLSSIEARTSWQEGYNADTAMAFMNMHEVFVGDHQNMYTGDFQIYYKGLLAMNTGTYNVSTAHNEGYKRRAIAGNTMLVYDPSETFVPSWSTVFVPNDGGQRNPYVANGASKGASVGKLTEYALDSEGKATNEELIVAKDVVHYIGPNEKTPEISYISGNLESAYSEKVQQYKRSMAFLDLDNEEYPAAFIVYDKLRASNADFKKTWLMHSQEQPQISGSTTTITREGNGFGGKLVNTTMLPLESDIQIIGGETGEMFTVGGHLMAAKANAIEGGKYRIEISPKASAAEDVFLNAMYVTDSDNETPLDMIYEEASHYLGVTVLDRTVLFGKDALEEAFSVKIRNNGHSQVSVFVADVSEGLWKVTGDGVSINVEADKNNCIFFKAPPGEYTVAPTTQAPAHVAYQEMTKRGIGDFYVWRRTGSTNNTGSFIYLREPARLVDGKPFIHVSALEEFGAAVQEGQGSAEITVGSSAVTVSAGSGAALIDGKLYVEPQSLSTHLGYDFSFKTFAKILFVTEK